MSRVTIRGRHQHGRRADQHRLARVRIQDVGKQLLGGVDVGPVDELVAGLHVDPRARGLVRVVGGPEPAIVVRGADHHVDQPLLLVQAQQLAHFARAAEHQVRAIEEDGLLGHRHDEAALGSRWRFDVILAKAQAGIRHAGMHLIEIAIHAGHAGNLLAVEPRGNRVDELRHHERLLRVGLHDLGIDHLASDVEKRGHIDPVSRFHQRHARAVARIEAADPFVSVGHQPFGQIAQAEVLGPQVMAGQRFAQMRDSALGAVEFITSFQFASFDHVKTPEFERNGFCSSSC